MSRALRRRRRHPAPSGQDGPEPAQEALYAAVLARYNISSRADVPLSEAEGAKVVGYVRAYTGPPRALLTRYLSALTP